MLKKTAMGMVVLIVAGAWLTAPAMAASEQGCTVHVALYWDEQHLETWENASGDQTTLLATGIHYLFYAGCNCGHNVTLTSSFGESDGPSESPSIEKTFSGADMSTDLNDTWVKATCQHSSQECLVEFTVLDMFFNPFERARPTKDESVDLIFSWCLCLSGGREVELDCERTSGTKGSVTDFSPNSTTEPQTTLTFTGGEQTNVGGGKNMQLQAIVSYDIMAASKDFSVCAHPCNGRCGNQNNIMPMNWYGFSVDFMWDSDSDKLEHLDAVLLHEEVRDFEARQNPPFLDEPAGRYYQPLLPPAEPGGHAGTKGSAMDTHFYDKNDVTNPPAAGDYETEQDYEFHCKRCMSNPEDAGSWVPFSPFSIKREVKLNPQTGKWEFITSKTGQGGPFSRTQHVEWYQFPP